MSIDIGAASSRPWKKLPLDIVQGLVHGANEIYLEWPLILSPNLFHKFCIRNVVPSLKGENILTAEPGSPGSPGGPWKP